MVCMKHAGSVVGVLLAVVVVMVCGAPRALAQYHPVTEQELDRYVKMLDLSEAQREALLEMLEGYTAAFQRAQKAQREAQKRWGARFTELMNQGVTDMSGDAEYERLDKERSKTVEALHDAATAVESGFLDDMELVLTAEQAERMDVVHRTRRRLRFLWTTAPRNFGRAAVDLVDLVEEIGFPAVQETALAETLEAWEQAVDASLRQIERLSTYNPQGGVGRSLDDVKKINDLEERVDRAMERHAQLLAAALPEDAVLRFETMYQAAKWPDVYKTPPVAALLKAATALELDAAQREKLDGLLAWHAKQLAEARKLWMAAAEEAIRATREFEENAIGLPPGKMAWYYSESPETQAKRQTSKDRRTAERSCDALNEQARQKLQNILTDAQFETLPEMQ